MSGKYKPGDRPREGRLAIMPDETEESWLRRSTERNWAILQVVDQVARSYAATHAQVSLAWLLHQPAVSSVIIGARTLDQLEEDLAAGRLALSEEDLARLSLVSEPDDPYPYRFLRLYGSRELNPEA
jgi:aryl-alcohol dehydrogenase-like predicted oxidoreductase